VDDVLDLTASERVLGKPVASDLREGKVTMAVIHALERCTSSERKKIAAVVEQRAGPSHAQPFGSTGSYYSVGLNDGTTGVIDLSSFADISSISLLWGSIDTYNTLQFLDSANNVLATFGGSTIINPAVGNQSDPSTNRVVTFLLTGTDVTAFSRLRLTSNSNAFEIDNLAINPILVPEPVSWVLMLLGFCGLGLSIRRHRSGLPQVA